MTAAHYKGGHPPGNDLGLHYTALPPIVASCPHSDQLLVTRKFWSPGANRPSQAKGWSEEEKRAYRLADNQLAARASWDFDLLGHELQELGFGGIDIGLIGFEPDELETILAGLGSSGLTDPDSIPEILEQPVTMPSDSWLFGEHGVGCGG